MDAEHRGDRILGTLTQERQTERVILGAADEVLDLRLAHLVRAVVPGGLGGGSRGYATASRGTAQGGEAT